MWNFPRDAEVLISLKHLVCISYNDYHLGFLQEMLNGWRDEWWVGEWIDRWLGG